MHVLIVEDDCLIAENLYDFLEACGHRCDFTANLAGARALLAGAHFDAILLDRNLPDGDGALLAAGLRQAGNPIPILMLTAKDTLDDKLAGFDAGADDYLAKPFALKEVEARLLALQRRRSGQVAPSRLSFNDLVYDPLSQTVSLADKPLVLPPKGLRAVEVFLQQPGKVFSRRELEQLIWGHEQASSDNLRSVLHTVRKAIGEQGRVEIVNMHGLGYKLVGH